MFETDPDLLGHLEREMPALAGDRLRQALVSAERLAFAWSVEIGGWLPGATCSVVLHGMRDGQEVVLRVPMAEEEATAGFAAMIAYSGLGGVEVLESDSSDGSTLMPRIRPGTNLEESGLTEMEKIHIASDLMLNFQKATVSSIWSHERWFRELWNFKPRLDDSGDTRAQIDPEFLDLGKRMARHLLATTERKTVLHGDLHHYNILQQDASWVTIDPKGVLGDPAFEPIAFLRNPVASLASDPDLRQRQEGRIRTFADRLNEPIERIWGWAVAQIVLDAAWSYGDWSETWAFVARETFEVRPPEAEALLAKI